MLLFVSALNAIHVSVVFVVGHCLHTEDTCGEVSVRNLPRQQKVLKMSNGLVRRKKMQTLVHSVFDVVSVKRGETREVLIRRPVSIGRPPEFENVRS